MAGACRCLPTRSRGCPFASAPLAQNIRSDAGPAFDADPLTLQPVRVDPITGAPLSGFTHVQTLPNEQNVDYRLYNATINWNLGFADLTSVTSYGNDATAREDRCVL